MKKLQEAIKKALTLRETIIGSNLGGEEWLKFIDVLMDISTGGVDTTEEEKVLGAILKRTGTKGSIKDVANFSVIKKYAKMPSYKVGMDGYTAMKKVLTDFGVTLKKSDDDKLDKVYR